jgi:hypothetical protein
VRVNAETSVALQQFMRMSTRKAHTFLPRTSRIFFASNIAHIFASKVLHIFAANAKLRGSAMKKPNDSDKSNRVKRNVRRIRTGVHRNRHIRDKIDRHLREAYDQVVEEGTPDRFARLVKQVKRSKDEEEST